MILRASTPAFFDKTEAISSAQSSSVGCRFKPTNLSRTRRTIFHATASLSIISSRNNNARHHTGPPQPSIGRKGFADVHRVFSIA
jgi:hypothetical protein